MELVNKLSSIRLDLTGLNKSGFRDSLQVENKSHPALETKSNYLVDGINSFVEQMKKAEIDLDQKIEKLDNSQFKALFELQRTMQSIQLTTEVTTKSADAVLGSARRVQQMGSN